MKFFRTLAVASVVLLARSGVAQVSHGAMGGAHALWVSPTTVLMTAGSGLVDGAPFQAPSNLPAWAGAGLLKSSIYYCYVANTGLKSYNESFAPDNFTFFCLNVAPNPDGHPSAAIVDPNPPAQCNAPLRACHPAANTNALFVGSFITDANASVVPFYRNGDQVVFVPQNRQVVDFDPGAATNGTTLFAANSASTAYWTLPLLPLSASQVILDMKVHNNDSGLYQPTPPPAKPYFVRGPVPHLFCIYDPYAAVAGPSGTCQAQFWVNSTDEAGLVAPVLSAMNYRAEVDATRLGRAVPYGTNTGDLGYTLGCRTCNPATNPQYYPVLYASLVYRGYVEPLSHLVSRDTAGVP